MNIHLIMQMAAEAMGDREALVEGDFRITYGELDYAAQMVAEKIKTGEKLGYLMENNPAFPAALFGAALAGAPFVPLNYRLTADQLFALLQRTAPALLITHRDVAVPKIRPIHPRGLMSGVRGPSTAPDDAGTAIELFTSGTTGAPKSAILRHANLLAYIFGSVEFMSAGEDEAALISVPPYHIAGISAVLSSVYAGRRMVQLPNFTASDWIRLAQTENVTHAFVVPTMLSRIIEFAEANPGKAELPAMRALAYGGGKMPEPVIRRAMQIWPNIDYANAYGLTETSSTICILGPEDHNTAFASDDAKVRRRLGSVGQALPTVELQVRSEEGQVCEAGETGLVFVRGDQVAGEYKEKGSLLDGHGWFPTRDRGFLDADGYLYIDGRADDVIVRGGENISPGEIEAILRQHPGVKDVAVVAVPDEQWGEAVGAAIVCTDKQPGTDELCETVKNALRSSRVPSVIRFVDELPYNETGKLLRRIVRDDLAKDI